MKNATIGTLAAASIACGLASTAQADISPLLDPQADTIDLGFGGPLTDLETISLSYSETAIHFDVSFYTPIAPTSANLPESLFGWMEFDVDQNPATGFAPFQNFYDGLVEVTFGTDIALNLADTANPGQMQVVNVNTGPLGLVPVTYTNHGFSGSIPLSMIGEADGLMDFVITIGTPLQPTDATNVVGTSAPIPEPAAASLLALGAVAGLAHRRRRPAAR